MLYPQKTDSQTANVRIVHRKIGLIMAMERPKILRGRHASLLSDDEAQVQSKGAAYRLEHKAVTRVGVGIARGNVPNVRSFREIDTSNRAQLLSQQ